MNKPLKQSLKILVVDDTPDNLEMVGDILSDAYQVQVAINGRIAFKIIEKSPPDLILLDIMMPEMDGYEVCQRLKANPSTAEIPVIFVTALDSSQDEAHGLELGAVDYISKPFSSSILKVRIANHLARTMLLRQVNEQNQSLQKSIAMRELVENINRHDLKGPLNSLIHYPRFIRKQESQLSERSIGYLQAIETAALRMVRMIEFSLDMLKIEQGTYQLDPKPVELLGLLRGLLREQLAQIMVMGGGIELRLRGVLAQESESCSVAGDELLIYQMLVNLLKNGYEASPPDEQVVVDIQPVDDSLRDYVLLTITNRGAVPEEIRENFFEKLITFGKQKGTGLGTYSAALCVRALRGQIQLTVDDEHDQTTITIRLPPARES